MAIFQMGKYYVQTMAAAVVFAETIAIYIVPRDGASYNATMVDRDRVKKECFDWLSRQGQLIIGSQDAATVSQSQHSPVLTRSLSLLVFV